MCQQHHIFHGIFLKIIKFTKLWHISVVFLGFWGLNLDCFCTPRQRHQGLTTRGRYQGIDLSKTCPVSYPIVGPEVRSAPPHVSSRPLRTCWWCLWSESPSPAAAASDGARYLPGGSDTAAGSCWSAAPAIKASAHTPRACDGTSSGAPSKNGSLPRTLSPETTTKSVNGLPEVMLMYYSCDTDACL